YVSNVEEVVKEGEKIKVKVLDIDKQGKISLKRIEE
ncbi:MAG: S1 RNA-binding domain-containing protein, partial [Actinobacteria bacterium]